MFFRRAVVGMVYASSVRLSMVSVLLDTIMASSLSLAKGTIMASSLARHNCGIHGENH